MAFDLTLDPRVVQWRERIATFVADVVIPREQRVFEQGLTDGERRELQAAARAAGVWAPQVPRELGGGGFRLDEAAVLLEEAGTSLLGPLALNCSAPDEGNIHLLHLFATPAQRARYLVPLVNGDVRSCFAMTEPPPGAGSDPAALATTARRRDHRWLISGVKHLITGADGAAFAIVMARGGGGADLDQGATLFLVDTTAPGWRLDGHARTIDRTTVGGHCRIVLDDVEVGDDAVLGEPGEGFRHAQARLAPARLTHCMRWLGAARRAHGIALERAVGRQLFGSPLAGLGMAQQLIADNEIDLAAGRALLWQTAWQLATGARGTEESSRAKVFISEATARVVDRSVQLAGGMGTSEELVLGRIYADIRSFRIYDGSSETHRMSIARRAARRAAH
ncbi:acyl-CoA dehydrogenase family protein [Kineosporia sp. J2-2]|uniref:Acyl-CoA dehydrogenase family protein n=1 Tax=Kineosporia corallincola TaxID=2835133 RepID=A0ABS5TMY7_9ACTN|nr:acyl-CoA dehydrogenase family protein [Kineosporia corallincola]MBT0771566.1 acyl-CoA dehydrogenase family protein [Kineosporia corallincola]